MPGDVDTTLKQRLEQSKASAKVQREFDLNAWQMFLALNWPTDDQGPPASHIEDTGFGAPHWTLWHNSISIFQEKGAVPEACAKPPQQRQFVLMRNRAAPVSAGLLAFRTSGDTNVAARTTRFVGVISAVGELNAVNLGGDIRENLVVAPACKLLQVTSLKQGIRGSIACAYSSEMREWLLFSGSSTVICELIVSCLHK
jgi:hypothetical protein